MHQLLYKLQIEDLFSPSQIKANILKISKNYKEVIFEIEFDDSLLTKEKEAHKPPIQSNFTPFAKQGSNNKLKTHFNGAYNHKIQKPSEKKKEQGPLTCQRILNYESNLENVNFTNSTLSQIVIKCKILNLIAIYYIEFSKKYTCFPVCCQGSSYSHSDDHSD